jgi:hypothetical protein
MRHCASGSVRPNARHVVVYERATPPPLLAEQVVHAATHLQAPLQVLENAHAVADVLVTILDHDIQPVARCRAR